MTKMVYSHFMIDPNHRDHIKKIAVKMSAQLGRSVSYGEAIRMALQQCYPLAQQLPLPGMEGKKKKV